MIFNATKKANPNYGKYRTKKVFALFPRYLYYWDKRYFVWLEYFYQDQYYCYDAGCDSDGWRIESNYPNLPGISPTYTEMPMDKSFLI